MTVNFNIDASGREAFSLVADRLRRAGIHISKSDLDCAMAGTLQRARPAVKIGEVHFFSNINTAVNAVDEQPHKGSDEENGPLRTVAVATENSSPRKA